MIFGPTPPNKLPEQNTKRMLTLIDRFCRNKGPHNKWAEQAKKCVDYVEGRQWDQAALRKLKEEGRPALTFNMIMGLVRLVLGFHEQKQTDTKFLPGNDENASEETAEALTMLHRNFSENAQLPFIDTEVFMDGLTAQRGFYDMRIDYSENDFGEVAVRAEDPFSIVIDSDALDYDSRKWNGFHKMRWASLDEIETTFGPKVRQATGSLVDGVYGISSFPRHYHYDGDIIMPETGFGHRKGSDIVQHWTEERYYDFVDPYRKNLRILEHQFYESQIRNLFVDLETGDKSVIPEKWKDEEIQKVLWLAEQRGNPMAVTRRRVRRVRWTQMVGDLIVFDDWSPYDDLTIVGYFPYFRRGQTRGMVDDLIDPQTEKNKRRSNEIDIVGRTLNSGWIHEEGALSPEMETRLDQMGASPGIRIEHRRGSTKPEKINPSPPPTAMERLEKSAETDMWIVSGINPTAQGQLDRVQSGRAMEQRKQAAITSIQPYFTNLSRTRELTARKFLNLVQHFYVETRMIRILGEGGKLSSLVLNQPMFGEDDETIVDRLRDITIGKYTVAVDETPISANFQSAQFEEMMEIIEQLAPALGPNAALLSDIAIEVSSLPKSTKNTVKDRLRQALGMGTAMETGTVPMPDGAAPAQPPSMPGGNVVPFAGQGA